MINNNLNKDSVIEIIQSALNDKDNLFANFDETNDGEIFFNELTKQIFYMSDKEVQDLNISDPLFGFCFNINSSAYYMQRTSYETEVNFSISSRPFPNMSPKTTKSYIIHQLENIIKDIYQDRMEETKQNNIYVNHFHNLRNVSYRLLSCYNKNIKRKSYENNIDWLTWLSFHYKTMANYEEVFNELYHENDNTNIVLDDINIMHMLSDLFETHTVEKTKINIQNLINYTLYFDNKQIKSLLKYKTDEKVKKIIFNYIENYHSDWSSLTNASLIAFFINVKELDIDNKYDIILNLSPMAKLSKSIKLNTLSNVKIVYDFDELSFLNSNANILKYTECLKNLDTLYILKTDYNALIKIKEAYELIDFSQLHDENQYKKLLDILNNFIKNKKLILINSISDII